jgi:hypothetical protein
VFNTTVNNISYKKKIASYGILLQPFLLVDEQEREKNH